MEDAFYSINKIVRICQTTVKTIDDVAISIFLYSPEQLTIPE